MTQWKYFPDTTPPRGLPLRLEVKEKDQNTGTPEPYYGKTLFQGFAVFDGERQKFCVHGIIGARQTGASNEHEHQTQFS